MSASGMMPPPKTTMSPASALAQQLDDPREQGHVGAGQDRQADRVGVLLDRRLDDLLGRLVQAGVDDLHAGVAQRAGDHLGPAVVAVQARLGDDDAERRLRCSRPSVPAGVRKGRCRRGRRTLLPSRALMPRPSPASTGR